ncbi:MAG TPA: endo-1,3-alpha-glucanase family glycosylhydrolase [Anaerolineales bacterium]|nr:endo-1,3-alpha-glucanase family glycosylhydrolase [Anaerolineales bacterium]
MNRTIYRIMGIILALALALEGFSNVQATSSEPVTSGKPVYAYYYLWWSTQHWKDKLGANYPYTASPLPLPATTDADGCNAVSKYPGNQLIDIPSALFSQDDPGVIEGDIRTAKNAGISGFWLNWNGDGTTTQTRTSLSYTRRLSEAFAASARVGGFKNWVSYKAASMPTAAVIINDLNFLYKEFNGEAAWERIDGKPVVTFTGSRKYSDADVLKISSAVRDRIFLVGDETRTTLTTTRIAMFDAITYYWSSQDPYGNPASFSQIKEMGDKVHAAGKRWYAPVTPGFNTTLLTGGTTCVPRRNGDTIRTLWNGNAASNPDGWGFISWNEIGENTHIKPLQKWGNTSLNVLASLIGSAPVVAPTATPTKIVLPSPTFTQIVPTSTLIAPTATLIAPTAATIPATVTVAPTSASTTAKTFDDKNAALVYSSGWQSVSTTNAYGGSYKETTQNGTTVTFPFTGQSFSLIYKGGVTFSKFDVYMDGALVGTLDQKLSTTTYQKRWDYPAQLTYGSHTLKLVFKVTSSTIYRGSLDAVIVR